MAQNKLIALLAVLMLLACQKEDPIPGDPNEENTETTEEDTTSYPFIEPCEYFPAYPGSWWTYDVVNGSPVTYEIDSDTFLYQGELLPKFTNLDVFVRGCEFWHSAYHGQGQSSIQKPAITLDGPVSQYWDKYSTVSLANLAVSDIFIVISDVPYRRDFYAADSTVTTLNGDTFSNCRVVKEYHESDSTHHYLEFFAPGVGLVKRDLVDPADTLNTTEIFTLNQYFINQ